MSDQVKALLFDFGGVYTDSPFVAVHEFGEELGVDSDDITDIVFGSYENDGDHPWHQLERGEISLEDARQAILTKGREKGLEIDIYNLFAKFAETKAGASDRSVLVDKTLQLRSQGYQTGMITNNVKEFGDGWRSLLPVPVEEMFHFVIDSSHVGVRKPDRRIFEMALAQLGDVSPSQVIFLDDYQGNINAAKSLGLQTLLVEGDPMATIKALDSLLIP